MGAGGGTEQGSQVRLRVFELGFKLSVPGGGRVVDATLHVFMGLTGTCGIVLLSPLELRVATWLTSAAVMDWK